MDIHINAFNFFILRTPLYSLEFINKLIDSDVISNNDIKAICANKIISEAIYIASPPLYYEMQRWLKNEIGNRRKDDKKINKLKDTLIRYFFRMATRCTPFGLFAGLTTGEWDTQTDIQLLPKSQNVCHTRLDMNYLCSLAIDLSKHESIKNEINFFPNNSIYRIGDKLRYIEYKYVNSRRIHHIMAVDNSEYLNKILINSKRGCKIKKLVELLVNDSISSDDAIVFLNELIESQILVSELYPTITGDEFLHQILQVLFKLKQNEQIHSILKILNHTKIDLENISINRIGKPTQAYEKIAKNLKILKTNYELKYLFQSDMIKPSKKCKLDYEIINGMIPALEVLNKLSSKRREDNLSKFRTNFYNRYGEEEIPLLQALDVEFGIGYIEKRDSNISPLVDDLSIPVAPKKTYDFKWSDIDAFLHRKYVDAIKSNHKIIEIFDKDIDGLDVNWEDIPATFSAMIQIFKGSKNGEYVIYIKTVGGSTAANLIGRFCHIDKVAHQLVKQIIKKDEAQNRDSIFAEIAHLPESRTGNILLRPTLRKYELPYLANSSVANENKIEMDDLLISVRNSKVLLRSKRLNKFIIPRLTSAHNFSHNALPVYHFLCDLQTQNIRGGIGFNWGPLQRQHAFLPRVVYKNIILSRASWNFTRNDIEEVIKVGDEKIFNQFQLFAKRHHLPDEVLLSEGDNELYLNLKSKMCVKILISQVKNRPTFTLKEFLFNNSNLIVNNSEGGFTNEFVVAFYKKKIELQ